MKKLITPKLKDFTIQLIGIVPNEGSAFLTGSVKALNMHHASCIVAEALSKIGIDIKLYSKDNKSNIDVYKQKGGDDNFEIIIFKKPDEVSTIFTKPEWSKSQIIRKDKNNLIEDICKHGVGHPNHEFIKSYYKTKRKYEDDPEMLTMHGCCGCCHKNYEK